MPGLFVVPRCDSALLHKATSGMSEGVAGAGTVQLGPCAASDMDPACTRLTRDSRYSQPLRYDICCFALPGEA